MSESADGRAVAESAKEQIRSRRPTEMEIGSRRRERTHKDKAFSFSKIDNLDHERTHSEYRFCYQLLAAIWRPISANFEWIASPDCRLRAKIGGRLAGRPIRKAGSEPGGEAGERNRNVP